MRGMDESPAPGLAAPAALLAMLAPRPVAPVALPPARALGAVLAEELRAPRTWPPAPLALRAGWAVAAADTLGASPHAPLPLPARPAAVLPGDSLPPGADAVLPPFALEEEGPLALALADLAPGEGTRRGGEDLAEGALLRAAGQALRPQDLPALAALGITAVAVRRPRVALLGEGPAAALLRALLGDAAATEPPDLLVAAGTAPPAGVGWLAGGLGARPGMAVRAGLRGGAPVVALPDTAEEALAAWTMLIRPLLRALSGAGEETPLRLRLRRNLPSLPGLAELALLRVEGAEAEPLAVGAAPLAALAAAAAWLVVPAPSEGYEAGQEIEAMPL